MRLHDLRHSFASDALMGGMPLAVASETLGLDHPQRYAQLADHVVREADEGVWAQIESSMI